MLKQSLPLVGVVEYDKIFKIILIGSQATGKSSLVNRFIEDKFEEESLTTIGIDLKSITIKIDELLVRL